VSYFQKIAAYKTQSQYAPGTTYTYVYSFEGRKPSAASQFLNKSFQISVNKFCFPIPKPWLPFAKMCNSTGLPSLCQSSKSLADEMGATFLSLSAIAINIGGRSFG